MNNIQTYKLKTTEAMPQSCYLLVYLLLLRTKFHDELNLYVDYIYI